MDIWLEILIYIIAESITVVACTIKSVVIVKGSKKIASIVTSIYYTVSALVTYLIATFTSINLWVIIPTTLLTNLIGVYIGLIMVEKLKKDVLWRISATVRKENYDALIQELVDNDFKFVTFETNWNKIRLIDVFTLKREKSRQLGIIFERYDVKYTISTNHHRLPTTSKKGN